MNTKTSYSSKHPRPDFAREESWLSLNGEWDFKKDENNIGLENDWFKPGKIQFETKIQVPFAWETSASGIQQEWMPVGWYRKYLEIPEEWLELHPVIHFGAVHYHCQAWIDGTPLGAHTGGYLPFEFDLMPLLENRKGELVIRVEAPLDKRFIPHGKQRSNPNDDYNDCAFTASSGIWQSVWLEARPATYVESVVIRPDDDLCGFQIGIHLNGSSLLDARLDIEFHGHSFTIDVKGCKFISHHLAVSDPRKWQPDDPFLYSLKFHLHSKDGIDQVYSYTGLRKIEVRNGTFWLNDKQIFLRGALDQGYWPEGGYTAPDDLALKLDVELALSAGYNLIRKHIKLEDPRWLYWADQLGLLVWEEPPCFGRYSPEAVKAFESQILPMVERDGNHPCIILWGLYNEEWGMNWELADDPEKQQAVSHAYELLANVDHTRPIIDNSGWWHVKTDVLDWHYYDEDMISWHKVCAALASSNNDKWFGHRLSDTRWYNTKLWVPGWERSGLPLMNGEYGGGRPENQGWLFRWQTPDIHKYPAFSGYIYTELYDVEHEIVGMYTAQRKLKDLGCHPTMVNAETVLCFDIVPIRPGLDYIVAENGIIEINLQVVHHGQENLQADLRWRWRDEEIILQHRLIDVNAHSISSTYVFKGQLALDQKINRLLVQLINKDEKVQAENYIDIGLNE